MVVRFDTDGKEPERNVCGNEAQLLNHNEAAADDTESLCLCCVMGEHKAITVRFLCQTLLEIRAV